MSGSEPALVMYCPKCGSPMDTSGRDYRCLVGNMWLSDMMKGQLVAGFIDPGVQDPPRAFGFGIGGRWFCPRDQGQMVEADGFITCPRCGRSLNQYIYFLIELHPHKGR